MREAGAIRATFKTILVHLDDRAECRARVTLAAQLAQAFDAALAGTYVVPYLERHGVHVGTTDAAVVDDGGVGEWLLSRAADLGSDSIVMGGYAHSPLQERVLGGVTRTMLESMTVPLLMSH